MWIAVCSNQQCKWDREAECRLSAELHRTWHVRQFSHRAVAVEIEDPQIKSWHDLDRFNRPS